MYKRQVWTHVDSEKYGIGWVKCKIKDQNGSIVSEYYPDTRKSNDVHDQWIRTEIRIPVKKDYTIEISMETNRTIYIDELLLRPEKMIHVIDVGKKDLLINGYKVRR